MRFCFFSDVSALLTITLVAAQEKIVRSRSSVLHPEFDIKYIIPIKNTKSGYQNIYNLFPFMLLNFIGL